jgi:nucleoside-diphosphate-sugar epimerase
LVTGAAGRLGRVVTTRLHDEGYELVGTDLVDPGDVPYPFSSADLLDHASASRLLEGVDVVIHLGNHPGLGVSPPQVVFSQNTTMNANVFQAAAERGVGRIIFASTLQLIGSHVDSRTVVKSPPSPTFPLSGDTPARPANLYALSKAVAEQMLQYYTDRCGIDCVALRLPLLHYGDNQRGVNTGGETSIDIVEGFTGLTYRDAAAAFLAVLRSDLSGYRSYMAGTAHRHNDLDIDELIRTFYPSVAPGTPDLVDHSALTRETGWVAVDDYHHPRSQDHST